MSDAADITVYGAPWCPDCQRSTRFLTEQRVRYNWIDIDKDPQAGRVAKEKADGKQIIPLVAFADGSVLAEQSNDELARKLGLQLTAKRT